MTSVEMTPAERELLDRLAQERGMTKRAVLCEGLALVAAQHAAKGTQQAA